MSSNASTSALDEPPTESPTPDTPLPLSKNAQKKAAKLAKYIAEKAARRAHEKQVKKVKKAAFSAKRDAGELDPDELELDEERKRVRKRMKKNGKDAWKGKIVIDLGFDDMMIEKVLSSVQNNIAHANMYLYYRKL